MDVSDKLDTGIENFKCIVDSRMVPARLISLQQIECLAPSSSSSSSVQVQVMQDNEIIEGTGWFNFYASPRIMSVRPTSADVDSQVIVSVAGSNFVDGNLRCRFGVQELGGEDGWCWVLGVGCWVLGVGGWVLGVGCWVLGDEC